MNTHPLTKCEIWIRPTEFPTTSCDPSGDQQTLDMPSPSIEPSKISLCIEMENNEVIRDWNDSWVHEFFHDWMKRMNSFSTFVIYPVGGRDADGGKSGKSTKSPVWRPGNRRDGVKSWRAVEQQLAQRIPNLKMAIFTTASNKVRYRTPGHHQHHAVVGFPL